MNLQDVRKHAKTIGINAGKLNKTDLIKTIQQTEGNFDCFATASDGFCDQGDCMWMDDCLKTSQKTTH